MSNPTQPQKRSKDLVVVAAVVVAVGLVAAIGWAIHRAALARSWDPATNSNLRFIQAGPDQCFMEHPGVTSVGTATLIGTNSTQIANGSFVTVAQEPYDGPIPIGQSISAAGVAGVRTVTYGP